MTAGARRVVLGFGITIGGLQLVGGASWSLGSSGDSWALITLLGGIFVVIGLLALPLWPSRGSVLAFAGALLGSVLWASPTALVLSWVLMTTILALFIIYSGMRTTAVVKALVWASSVILLGFSLFGAFAMASLQSALLPWPLPPAVFLSVPIVVLILVARSSHHPTSLIARFRPGQ